MMNDSEEMVSSRNNRADAHLNKQRLWQHTWDLHRFKSKFQHGEGEVDMGF